MKKPVCTVDYKLQWIGQNISSPDKKTLTQMTIVHAPLFSLFIVVSVCAVGGYWGISDSLQTLHNAPLFLSLSRFPDSDRRALCVSVCLALSLPPTTHSMLYKSYINASSTPFLWWTSQPHLFSKPLYTANIFTGHFNLFILHNILEINQHWQSQGI